MKKFDFNAHLIGSMLGAIFGTSISGGSPLVAVIGAVVGWCLAYFDDSDVQP